MKNFQVHLFDKNPFTIKADAFQITESTPTPLLSFVNIKEVAEGSDKASYEVVAAFQKWIAVTELPPVEVAQVQA